jgi:hypothetical protein
LGQKRCEPKQEVFPCGSQISACNYETLFLVLKPTQRHPMVAQSAKDLNEPDNLFALLSGEQG